MDQQRSGSRNDTPNTSQSAEVPTAESSQAGGSTRQPSLEGEAQSIDFAKALTSAKGEALVGEDFANALVEQSRDAGR